MRRLFLLALMGCLSGSTVRASAAFQPIKPGEYARYRLSYQGEGTIHVQEWLAHRSGSADRVQTRLRSQLEIVQMTPTLVAVRLLAPAHQTFVNGQAQDLKQEITSFKQPCYLTLDLQGLIQTISFAPGTAVSVRGLMRALVSDLEFARPERAGRQWRILQDTQSGYAEAAYRMIDRTTCEKRLLAYPVQREIGPKGVPQMHPETTGALRFTFQQGRLQSVCGEYSTRFLLAGKSLSEGQERFALTWLQGTREAPEILRRLKIDYLTLLRQGTPAALHGHDEDASAQAASWSQLLRGATPASLLADLQAVDAQAVRNDSGVYSQLCALFSLHPETCDVLQRETIDARSDKTSSRLVIAALGAVASASRSNSKAAQAAEQALCGVLASHQNRPDIVMMTAPSLGMASAPRLETLQLLQSLSQSRNVDIVISSALALGSMAQHCPFTMKQAIVHYLGQSLATADDSLKEHFLAALGNAGAAESLDAVATYTHHSSPRLRSVAYMSLRFIPGARVMTLLYRGLQDTDPNVRLNAARAFQFRPFSAADVGAFTAIISREKMESVRLSLLENLKLEADYHPQARSFLQCASVQDTSREIRQTVAEWLKL